RSARPRDRQRPERVGLSLRPAGIRCDPGVRADAELLPRRPDAPPGARGSGLSGRILDRVWSRPAGLLEPEPDSFPGGTRPGGLGQPEPRLVVVGQRPARVPGPTLRRVEASLRRARRWRRQTRAADPPPGPGTGNRPAHS